jgi:crotonobetainyl-CoA:carnitine CoA-transferase CaiB-like acyl-CoA transferase
MQPTKESTASGPLAGMRIVDLTSVVLGPLATQILGDWGADVLKIESPAGDLMRSNGVSLHPGMSSIFLALNRNKRSLCLDLATAEGATVLARLIATADVFVHNMRIAAMERLGFGAAAVAALNPRIVYCAATGFDQDGPDRNKPAFDDIIQAGSGLAVIASAGRDEPAYVPTLVADKTAGLAVANAILAALLHRERTGEGQALEVPMLETFTAFVLAEHLGGLTFDQSTVPAGYARLLSGGRRPSPTRDGYIAILPYTGEHWEALFAAMERADLAQALQVTDRQQRNANIHALYAALAEITRSRSSAEWLALCERLDIPATRLYSLDELVDHPQLQAVGLLQTMQHPSEGTIRYVRPTTKFSKSPASVRRAAPQLGQHSCEVLSEAGYAREQIETLLERGAVLQHRST